MFSLAQRMAWKVIALHKFFNQIADIKDYPTINISLYYFKNVSAEKPFKFVWNGNIRMYKAT